MTTDVEGRDRRGIYLPSSLWDWLNVTSGRDGTSVSDLIEGLVLLAMDGPLLPSNDGSAA